LTSFREQPIARLVDVRRRAFHTATLFAVTCGRSVATSTAVLVPSADRAFGLSLPSGQSCMCL
jgi:hypothetical protein